MDILETTYLNNPLYLWLLAVAAILAILFLFSIFRNWITRRVVAIEATGQETGQRNILDAFLVAVAVHTRPYFVFAVALFIGSLIIKLNAELKDILEVIVITLTLLQFGFWATNLINYWIERKIRQELERNNTNATTLSGLGLVARIILWSILTLMILENVTGIQVNTLVASLGITGIAVALAVQNILGDLFASLSITLDRPFVIGDFIIVGDFSGSVEHIGLKSTRIRSLSGEQLIFANSDLLNSRIRNFKRMERRRVVFFLDLTYRTPPEKIEKVPQMVREIIVQHKQVTFDRAHFQEFRDSSLHFEIVYFIETPDYLIYMDTQQAIILEILKRFSQEGIEFAYPTQVVFLQQPQENRII